MFIKDIMSRPAICIDYKSSIKSASKLMKENNISFLPVTKEDYLVGVITNTDLLTKGKKYPSFSNISKIMTQKIYMIDINSSFITAKKIMKENNVNRLIVIDEYLIKGVITNKDLQNCKS